MLDWPLFLGRFARDAFRDRAGVYALDAPYRTRYLSQPGIALSCAASGGLPYVMLRTDLRPELLRMDAYPPSAPALPVAIVDEWSEITPAHCDRWLARFDDAFDRAPLRRVLSSAYWLDRVHGIADA